MKNLLFLFLFITANLLGQIPPPLTGNGSTVRMQSSSRSAPERFQISVTDTLCNGTLTETLVTGLPHSNFEIQYQYGWYVNKVWHIHSYETTIGTTNGIYVHNYRFVDDNGVLLDNLDFAVWAHAFDLSNGGREYYGYSDACSHGWQGSCEDEVITTTTLDFCDTLYLTDTVYLPELVEAPEILINCPQYLSASPSTVITGNSFSLNFENPFGETQHFQIYSIASGVRKNITTSGIRTMISTEGFGVGTLIVYLTTPGFDSCGRYVKVHICERP